MNSLPDTDDLPETAVEPAKKLSKRKLILFGAPLALVLVGGGLWFTGTLPHMLGMNPPPSKTAEADADQKPTYVDVPEFVANLNSAAKRPSYVKMTIRIEVHGDHDAETVRTDMPRVQDIVQTYLREMRPEELRGSAGVYRLREELMVRANAAVTPARISDILFTQMLIQ
jgi:flagellar protein FliL